MSHLGTLPWAAPGQYGAVPGQWLRAWSLGRAAGLWPARLSQSAAAGADGSSIDGGGHRGGRDWNVSASPRRIRGSGAALGELHLLRGRLDGTLAEVAEEVEASVQERWARVEEAARLSRRAFVAAVAACRRCPATAPAGGASSRGVAGRHGPRRQWCGEAEFELTPLHHQLLAMMAGEPSRVFGKDELTRGLAAPGTGQGWR